MRKAFLVWLVAIGGQAAEPARLRPPAAPLVAHDPYFSIWSPADRLTDCETTHWTGKPHPLRSLVVVDGQPFRLCGPQPANTPDLPQSGLEVRPTATIYRFANAQIAIDLTFLTPAIPSDLEVLARPVTYVTWDVRSADGNLHAVQLDFEIGAELAVNRPDQSTAWERVAAEGLAAVRVGSTEQQVLSKKGDDLRIDWGYAYLAAPLADEPQIVRDATVRFNLGRVSRTAVTRHVMLGYDDLYSIKYFGEKLRPYWRRNGEEAVDLLRAAQRDYPALRDRCAAFDDRLMAELRRVGGEQYALLCALAYRQTWAGNKIAADRNGMPLVFPKENHSNGCISTVDVLFPQAPFFLMFNPALTRAMLVPILDYASSEQWPYPYAPHDLGTYPWATGQVYGMKGGDGARMPVEESGNMLIMLAALARAEGKADFAGAYWPLVTRWADYLVAHGLDPDNQLCSADMFGHLPHCVNLALKAILGIGGYAQLCSRLGKPEAAQKYLGIAREYAAKWQQLARDEGRTRLAYHLPGTWGMKHNLIWDRVLDLHLFPDALAAAEVAWYLRVQEKYGLPVDNRTQTSLIDWAMWSISLAQRDTDFQRLLGPLFRYAHETPSRVPLSDWFFTNDAKKKGFQARPVVGGLFIRLLADEAAWQRWAAAAPPIEGVWAPMPPAKLTREIVPSAQKIPIAWRYTLEKPAGDWKLPDFDDSKWAEAPAGFGHRAPGVTARTTWKSKDIWLRRQFTLAEEKLANPRLLIYYDEAPIVYVNGVLAAEISGWSTAYEEVEMATAACAAIRPGRNVIAVHCRQTYGGQFIDVGIVADAQPNRPTP